MGYQVSHPLFILGKEIDKFIDVFYNFIKKGDNMAFDIFLDIATYLVVLILFLPWVVLIFGFPWYLLYKFFKRRK